MSFRARLLRVAAAPALLAYAVPAFAAAPVVQDEIIVTASPIGRTVQETILGTSVMSGEELQRSLENSIGETLRREPGVSSTFFGPGSSRPVIRGLGGDRIRVLNAGIGSIDASATSPDHAVAVEPAVAERIEIVRGTSMLLYGSSAAGGVVNVFDGRIPTSIPENGMTGALRIGGSTVDQGVEAAGGFDLRLGALGSGALVFHGDGAYRKSDDYKIRGFAESQRLRDLEDEDHDDDDDHEHEDAGFGVVPNSAFETKGGAVGLSWVGDRGFFGVSFSTTDTLYGIPGGHGHHHGHEDEDDDDHDHNHDHAEDGDVRVDLRQRRFDLRSEFDFNVLMFARAKLRAGYADYEHAEIEPSGEIGTLFTNQGWEGRLELIDRPIDLGGARLNGAVGFQWAFRDFAAIGEEAFTPPTKSSQYGGFILKELATGPWRFEVGGRYESVEHRVVDTGFTRSFDGFSVSGGVGLKPGDRLFVGVTGFRTERAPSTEELFSDGPHLATRSFEVGDPSLDEEIAVGVEATMRVLFDRFTFTVNGFRTAYEGFIYEEATGAEEDGLPVFAYVGNDAVFRGFEVALDADLFQIGAFDVHADAAVEYVRASLKGGATGDLPRIPPLSTLFGLEAKSAGLDLRAELDVAAAQNRIADFELPTDGYQIVNLYATMRPFVHARGLSIRLSALNLANEEARLHTSFLKDRAPLPGRNFRIALTGAF